MTTTKRNGEPACYKLSANHRIGEKILNMKYVALKLRWYDVTNTTVQERRCRVTDVNLTVIHCDITCVKVHVKCCCSVAHVNVQVGVRRYTLHGHRQQDVIAPPPYPGRTWRQKGTHVGTYACKGENQKNARSMSVKGGVCKNKSVVGERKTEKMI